MSETKLNPAAMALLDEPVLAHVATVGDDGSPHVTPVWVDVEDDDVVINSAEGRAKTRNLRQSAKVAISVVDPNDPYRVVALQGVVADITTADADAHIDRLARKYLGVDRRLCRTAPPRRDRRRPVAPPLPSPCGLSYPMRQPGEQRVKVRIRPERVLMQPMPEDG